MSKNSEAKVTIITLVVVLVIVAGVRAAWAKLVYGDYKCAITSCVRVKP